MLTKPELIKLVKEACENDWTTSDIIEFIVDVLKYELDRDQLERVVNDSGLL